MHKMDASTLAVTLQSEKSSTALLAQNVLSYAFRSGHNAKQSECATSASLITTDDSSSRLTLQTAHPNDPAIPLAFAGDCSLADKHAFSAPFSLSQSGCASPRSVPTSPLCVPKKRPFSPQAHSPTQTQAQTQTTQSPTHIAINTRPSTPSTPSATSTKTSKSNSSPSLSPAERIRRDREEAERLQKWREQRRAQSIKPAPVKAKEFKTGPHPMECACCLLFLMCLLLWCCLLLLLTVCCDSQCRCMLRCWLACCSPLEL